MLPKVLADYVAGEPSESIEQGRIFGLFGCYVYVEYDEDGNEIDSNDEDSDDEWKLGKKIVEGGRARVRADSEHN